MVAPVPKAGFRPSGEKEGHAEILRRTNFGKGPCLGVKNEDNIDKKQK